MFNVLNQLLSLDIPHAIDTCDTVTMQLVSNCVLMHIPAVPAHRTRL